MSSSKDESPSIAKSLAPSAAEPTLGPATEAAREGSSESASEVQEQHADTTVGKKFDDSVDPAELDSISPHPPGEQLDRSVVLSAMATNAALWALRLLVIGAFLYAAGRMLGNFWGGLLPIVLALLICTVLAPISGKLRRVGVPGAIAALLTMLGFFGVITALIAYIAPNFARQSQTLYLQTVEGIQRLQLWAQGPPLNLNPEDIYRYVDEVASLLQRRAGDIAGSVFSGIGTATSLIVTMIIVVVLTFFFLKDGHAFLPWLRRATGRRAGWHLTEALTRAWNTLGGFIRAQAMVSAVDAVLIGLGLVIIGVPLALTLAIITFIAGFIPFVGAIVAGALSVTIALVSLGFSQAIAVLILVLVVQQVESNLLSPWLQSRAMNLHPVVVLISVTVGGTLFNLVGAFLAVPTVATIAVAYRYMQDMLQLQSGEKTVEDIPFATVAGHLVGKYTEEQSAIQRAQIARSEQSPAGSASGGVDSSRSRTPDNLNLDSSPTKLDHPSAREGLKKARAVVEQIFHRRGR